MIDDKALLSEYLSESEELLDSLLADLDSLASRGGESPDTNLINRAFRTVHSLKGLSGMMGLAEVQALFHDFEDILDDLRLGQLALSERTSAALQEAATGLAALVGGAARGTVHEEDFERLRELLAAVALKSRERARRDDSEVGSLNLSTRERALLTDYEEHRINENVRAGRSFYAITVTSDVGKLDKQYRALTARLEEAGELITTLPEKTGKVSLVGFKLVFAAGIKEADVKRISLPFGGRVARLERSTWSKASAALRAAGRKMPGRNANSKSDSGNLNVLPPSFAQESLQLLSPSVRVDMSQIDELSGLAHELSIGAEKLTSMAETFLGAANLGARERFDLRFSARRMKREFLELEERLVELRMVSLAQTFTRAARLAGRLARELGKSVSVEVAGRDTHLDKVIVDRVADSIYHVLRNAVDHGIESEEERRAAGKPARATIGIRAHHQGSFVHIEVADDGRGMDPARLRERAARLGFLSPAAAEVLDTREALNLIFLPGFSTAAEVTTTSGRGVGMDVVRANVGRLNGEIDVQSEVGAGTRITIKLPLTVIVSDALLVRAGGETFAVPMHAVRSVVQVRPEDIVRSGGRERVVVEEEEVELVRLDRVLALPAGRALTRLPVLVVRSGVRPLAVAVEELVGKEDVVIKNLGGLLERVGPFAGATITGAGRVILLVDPSRLAEATDAAPPTERTPAPSRERGPARERAARKTRRILLVDDSISVRKFVGQMLEKASFEVVTANDGAEALRRLGDTAVDLVITDLEMPRVSGYELIEDLRARAATRALPVVVLTTRAGAKHVNLARSLGIVHYVAKPVDEDAFVRLIVSLTVRGAAMAEVAR
jgi:chemotaxis protein histidine kinase CheA/ActR/RegA family two-component response regulator